MARKSFADKMRTRFGVITTSIDKANNYIHDTAVMIVEYIKAQEEQGNRDGSLAQELVMALPASMRREMLILAFSRFTPIVVKNDDKWAGDVHKIGTKMRETREWNIDAFKATPFFKLAAENPEAKFIDPTKFVTNIIGISARLEKSIEKGEVKPEDVDYLRAIAKAVSEVKLPTRPKAANINTAPAEDKATA